MQPVGSRVPPERSRVPGPLLRTSTDYAWRLLVVGITVYLALRVLGHLLEVVVPLAVALLFSALLDPLRGALDRRGFSRGWATLVTIVVAIVVLVGIGTLVVDRTIEELPQVTDQINALIPHIRHWLIHGPLHLRPNAVDNISTTLSQELSKHSSAIISAATTTGRSVVSFLVGLLLTFFITIFFLYDGKRVWHFVTLAFPAPARTRVDAGGRAAWETIGHYVHGTLVVAVFHGLAIAVVLLILGVPLVLPLAAIVAIGSFVPIVGAVVTGLVAVGVAGVTQGLTAAIIVAIILVVDNQVESHLLQPFVVGRYVHIHPLATVLALAAGAVLAGILGALFAVPIVATVSSAVKAILASRAPTGAAVANSAVATGPPPTPRRRASQRVQLRGPWSRRP